MYLKSLRLVGFKSFAEKTSLEFLPGVTAVVGPNGCGKSNIADAIRWVLGEQSAKALRGTEMADVIFNGTDGRKAIGMAEVSMTFAEVDPHLLSLPGVNLDFSEVTITRRVYRDGTGEYLINKIPCRLRDIQGMFLDTGIGRSSYSLMAQGQIDQILSAHPEDRRMIFEEAAGINKYKHQKKEALRKLEYTEANLVRLTDIIKEVKRQIISLQRQAGKARRYKELFDELKALDTRLSRHKFDRYQSEVAALETRAAESATRSEQFTADIAGHETQVAELRRSLAEIERAITDHVNRDHDLKSEIDRHQQRIGSNQERIAEFSRLVENHHREIAASEEKIRVQEQLLEALNAEYGQIDAQLAAEQARLQTQQAALKQLDGDLAVGNAAWGEAKTALIDLENGMTRFRNELAALDQKKKHDVLSTQRLSTEKLQLADQRQAAQQRLDQFHTGLVTLRHTLESLQAGLAALASEQSAVGSELDDATRAHQAATTALSEKRARLELLQQLFAAPDGRTTLGQILQVDPVYGAAVEAALRHAIQTVLADDATAARAWLAGGRNHSTVTSPDLLAPAKGQWERPQPQHPDTPSPQDPGSPPADAAISEIVATTPAPSAPAIPAASVVHVRDARFEPLVRSLLRNVVIVDDLDAALALRGTNAGLAMATKAGEFLSEQGLLSAVANSHIAEIGTLSDEVARREDEAARGAARQAELERKKSLLDRQLADGRAELHAHEVALATKEGELHALTTEQRDLDSKIQTVVYELQSIAEQDAEEKQRSAGIRAGLQEAEARETRMREQTAQYQQSVDELLARKDQQTHQMTEQRILVGGIEHKRQAIEAQREPIAARVRDLRERIQTGQEEIASHQAKMEQLRLEIAESGQKTVELGAQREQAGAQMAGFQHQRSEVALGIDQAEEGLRALRKQATEAREHRSGLDLELARQRMELQNLQDRVWQKYQVNVSEIPSDQITITVADHGPAVSEQVPRDTDWDAIELQVAEMQSRLDAMGPVNVEAIQEYDELEERFKFLSQQHEDLVKAKDQLLQVIAKINATTKQLFHDTFEKIRENFQAMFTELFGGGKANLLLLDESDPLESGIEIVAKPPGKQLQSITLLSGGEKTLTATALLFSIYMVKPSPFCVLDELDAPLDESNINRFIRILQRFINLSQFVVITHNKRTIGMADALYGITMEEHGVSKVVSVKFSPREQTERVDREQARKQQEDRIDGSASVPSAGSAADKGAYGLRPHEEDLRNDLLSAKEQGVAPIEDASPITAPEPVLASAPPAISDEVKAVVAAAVAANESAQNAVADTTPPPETKPDAPENGSAPAGPIS